jgi:hypothetical protein
MALRADRLLALPVSRRVAEARDSVGSWVTYDRSPEVVARHRESSMAGEALFDRALEIGAGDCDVQNALLAAMLDRAGVPSRLVIGYVGVEGRVRAGLHAWVEFLDEDGWQVTDASTFVSPVGPAPQNSTAVLEPGNQSRIESGVGATVDTPVPAVVDGRRLLGVAVLIVSVAAIAVITVGSRLIRGRRWTRSVVASDSGADMARLLRGALLRPRAYAAFGALYSRELVPMLDGRMLSLRRITRLASSGRLYRSDRGSGIARGAAERGVAVVDGSRAEGRAVADLVGASDLDAWDGLFERSRDTEPTRLVEEAAARCGERWLVRTAPDVPGAVAVHDGEPFGLGRGTRAAVIDEQSTLWRAVAGMNGRHAWAALLLGTVVVDRLAVVPRTRTSVVADLAGRAIQERLR